MENFGIEILECFSQDYNTVDKAGNSPNSDFKTCKLHAHSFYQYCYITQCSDAVLAVDNELIPVMANTFYIIKPFVQHSIFGGQNVKSIELKFSLTNPDLINIANKLPVIVPAGSEKVHELLKTLLAEYKNSSFNDPMFYVKFYEMMLVLNRLSDSPYRKDLKFKDYITLYNDSFKSLITFMYENHARFISLEEMAELVHFEKNYFIKVFKNEFDCTPMQFLNIIRANEAMSLLEYTELSVEEIAHRVGFAGVASLTNFFKTYFCTTPTEHRTRIRDKIKKKNNIVD